jgi:hypothetical protein
MNEEKQYISRLKQMDPSVQKMDRFEIVTPFSLALLRQ